MSYGERRNWLKSHMTISGHFGLHTVFWVKIGVHEWSDVLSAVSRVNEYWQYMSIGASDWSIIWVCRVVDCMCCCAVMTLIENGNIVGQNWKLDRLTIWECWERRIMWRILVQHYWRLISWVSFLPGSSVADILKFVVDPFRYLAMTKVMMGSDEVAG